MKEKVQQEEEKKREKETKLGEKKGVCVWGCLLSLAGRSEGCAPGD